jgi:hypothetical protein
MVQKFGEVGWGDVSTDNSSEKKDSRDTFLRLEKGSNILRIITPPFQHMVHKYKREGDPGFGQRIMCSAFHGSCPVCDLGDKAKRRWFLGVIDRKTKAYKILDVSIAVFKSIQNLTREDDWGSPEKYDIDIKVDPNGGATGYYTVMPKMPKPMSADDIELKDMVDLEDLKKRSSPPSVEKVQERLDKYLTGGGAPVQAARPAQRTAAPAPAARPVAARPVAPVVEESSDDLDFPSYDDKISFT